MATRIHRDRPDLDVYRWRERFRRRAFTVLREEYAARVTFRCLVGQIRNAARRWAPGRRVECRLTEDGDVVVTILKREERGAPSARAAAA